VKEREWEVGREIEVDIERRIEEGEDRKERDVGREPVEKRMEE
jgi:hypothetical protein